MKRINQFLTLGLVAVYLSSNCVLGHATETNFWKQRGSSKTSANEHLNEPLQLARLSQPNIISPTQILDQIPKPHPKSAPSVLTKRLKKEWPSATHSRLTPLIQGLPSHVGRIGKVSLSKGQPLLGGMNPVVLHIQDVHRNFEAQTNIKKTVEFMLTSNQVGLLGLEGAFSPIDLAYERGFPNAKATGMVADYLLKQNRISGPIHAAMTSSRPFPFIMGIDDTTLYSVNVEAFIKAQNHIVDARRNLDTWSNALQERWPAMNPDLRAFHKEVVAYRQGHLSIGAAVIKMLARVPTEDFNLKIFQEAYDLETTLNYEKAEGQRHALLEKLLPTLRSNELEELVQAGVAFRLGDMSTYDFYSYLKELCQSHRVILSHYPAMDTYIRYVLLSEAIDGNQLLSDVASLEKRVYEKLVRTPQERELVAQAKMNFLASKLISFSLTPDEWSEFKTTLKNMADSNLFSEGLDFETGAFAPFTQFYLAAEARNEAMVNNLLTSMVLQKTDTAILVTGGFHSPGLEQLLTQAGVSVVSFTPNLTTVDEAAGSVALSVFAHKKTPLDQLFKGEKLFLSPNPAETGLNPPLLRACDVHLKTNDPSISVPGREGMLSVMFAAGAIDSVSYMPNGLESLKEFGLSSLALFEPGSFAVAAVIFMSVVALMIWRHFSPPSRLDLKPAAAAQSLGLALIITSTLIAAFLMGEGAQSLAMLPLVPFISSSKRRENRPRVLKTKDNQTTTLRIDRMGLATFQDIEDIFDPFKQDLPALLYPQNGKRSLPIYAKAHHGDEDSKYHVQFSWSPLNSIGEIQGPVVATAEYEITGANKKQELTLKVTAIDDMMAGVVARFVLGRMSEVGMFKPSTVKWLSAQRQKWIKQLAPIKKVTGYIDRKFTIPRLPISDSSPSPEKPLPYRLYVPSIPLTQKRNFKQVRQIFDGFRNKTVFNLSQAQVFGQSRPLSVAESRRAVRLGLDHFGNGAIFFYTEKLNFTRTVRDMRALVDFHISSDNEGNPVLALDIEAPTEELAEFLASFVFERLFIEGMIENSLTLSEVKPINQLPQVGALKNIFRSAHSLIPKIPQSILNSRLAELRSFMWVDLEFLAKHNVITVQDLIRAIKTKSLGISRDSYRFLAILLAGDLAHDELGPLAKKLSKNIEGFNDDFPENNQADITPKFSPIDDWVAFDLFIVNHISIDPQIIRKKTYLTTAFKGKEMVITGTIYDRFRDAVNNIVQFNSQRGQLAAISRYYERIVESLSFYKGLNPNLIGEKGNQRASGSSSRVVFALSPLFVLGLAPMDMQLDSVQNLSAALISWFPFSMWWMVLGALGFGVFVFPVLLRMVRLLSKNQDQDSGHISGTIIPKMVHKSPPSEEKTDEARIIDNEVETVASTLYGAIIGAHEEALKPEAIEELIRVGSLGVGEKGSLRVLSLEHRARVMVRVDEMLSQYLFDSATKSQQKLPLDREKAWTLSFQFTQALSSAQNLKKQNEIIVNKPSHIISAPDSQFDESGFNRSLQAVKKLLDQQQGVLLEMAIQDAEDPLLNEFRNHPLLQLDLRDQPLPSDRFTDVSLLVERFRSSSKLEILESSVLVLPDNVTGLGFLAPDLKERLQVIPLSELLASMGAVQSVNLGLMMAIFEVIQKHA